MAALRDGLEVLLDRRIALLRCGQVSGRQIRAQPCEGPSDLRANSQATYALLLIRHYMKEAGCKQSPIRLGGQ
jgi:hypothetical protein